MKEYTGIQKNKLTKKGSSLYKKGLQLGKIVPIEIVTKDRDMEVSKGPNLPGSPFPSP